MMRRLLYAVIAMFVMGACTLPSPALPDLPTISQHRWALQSIDGEDPIEPMTALFVDGVLIGEAGCGEFRADYTLEEGTLTVADLWTDDSFCVTPFDLMPQRSAYLDALREAGSYQIDDERLLIGPLTFETMPQRIETLTNTQWVLEWFNGQPADDGYYLSIHEGGMMQAQYRLLAQDGWCHGPAYTIEQEPFVIEVDYHPNDGCDDATQTYYDTLAVATRFEQQGTRLIFGTPDDENALVFRQKVAPPIDPALLDTGWRLVSLQRTEIVANASLRFQSGGERAVASIYGGCNYGGGEILQATDGQLEVTAITSTAVACEGAIGRQEDAIFGHVRRTLGYRVEGSTLELLNDEGEVLAVLTSEPVNPLVTVDTWIEDDGSLSLSAGRDALFLTAGGCISMRVAYTTDGQQIRLGEVLDRNTEQDCIGGRNSLAGLRQALTTYAIDGDRLRLLDASGNILARLNAFHRQPPDPYALVGTSWLLTAIDGRPPQGIPDITLRFRENAWIFFGYGGCQGYAGSYRPRGGNVGLDISTIRSEACIAVESVAEQQATYLEALEAVHLYHIGEDRLQLSGGGMMLTFEALPETVTQQQPWELRSFVSAEGETTHATTEAVIRLDGYGNMSGDGGCNTFSGTFTADDGEIAIDVSTATRASCGPEIDEAEDRLLDILAAAERYEIDVNRLRLFTPDGREAVFVVR